MIQNVSYDELQTLALKLSECERLLLAKRLMDSCLDSDAKALERHHFGLLLRERIKVVDEGRMAKFDFSESIARVRQLLGTMRSNRDDV